MEKRMAEYCRINLAKTNYSPYVNAKLLTKLEIQENFSKIQAIYIDYCRYKKFTSVVPLFIEEFLDDKTDVFGYYDNDLIAWSLIYKFNTKNIENIQFAWNYKDPKIRLGIISLEHECSHYKELGCDYFYLGEAAVYKSKIQGYEILGEI